ncbi:hypothetical protein BBJ28_00025874 [Nothophytophthora sp. Chile5]|nr:hypothetical protein BBJ28_00025874 [Nothophytophthora sp. Chile5]
MLVRTFQNRQRYINVLFASINEEIGSLSRSIDGLGRSIQTDLTKAFDTLVQETNNRLDLMNARFDRFERSPWATKRPSSSDAPSRRSPAKVARGLSSQTVYDVDAAPKHSSPPAQAAEALPSSPTTSPTPAQAPPAPSSQTVYDVDADDDEEEAQGDEASAAPSPTPAQAPPAPSSPKAKAKPPTPKMKLVQKRERAKLETEIQTKAEEAPKIREKFTVVEMSWEDRTKSLATAEAKLAADPSDAAASESVANFNKIVKSLKKDKDALGAQLTLYELLEATAGAPKFLTDVNRRATSEKAKRATFNNKVKLAAGFLTARKNDFANAVDEEAKKATHKELEMATAAHKKASDDAAKQSNVATAVLAQKFQTKVSVDRMIELASTVLERLDAESIDADFVGVCADAKRDFVAFRKQVESFDAESVTL